MSEEKKDYLLVRLQVEADRFAVSALFNKKARDLALETLECLEKGTYCINEASEILSYLKALRL